LERARLADKDKLLLETNAQLALMRLQNEKLTSEIREYEENLQRLTRQLQDTEDAFTKMKEKEKETREEMGKMQHRFGSGYMRGSSSDLVLLSASSTRPATPVLSPSGTTGMLPQWERLQVMLSQRDGEIAVLQSQLVSLEATRRDLQDELASLTTRNEALYAEVDELKCYKDESKVLQARYESALQLIGEKEEKLLELTLDLAEWKEMYRNQINELIDTQTKNQLPKR